MYKNILYIYLIDTIAMLGFIGASRYSDGGAFRYFPLLLALVAIFLIAALNNNDLSGRLYIYQHIHLQYLHF